MHRRSFLRRGFGLAWGSAVTLAQRSRPWTPESEQVPVRPLGSGGLRLAPQPPVRGLTDWFSVRLSLDLADGDRVGTWPNRGSGPSATQATSGKRPAYETNVIGGQPALRFDADRVDYLTTGTIAALAEPCTVFFVIKTPETTPSATQFMMEGSVNQRRGVFYTTTRRSGAIASLSGPTTQLIPAGNGAVVAAVFDGASSLVRYNGIQTDGDTGAATSPTELVIGADFAKTRTFDGHIAEILIYDRHLASSEIAVVEGYLMRTYGLPRFDPNVYFVDSLTGSADNHGRTDDAPLALPSQAVTAHAPFSTAATIYVTAPVDTAPCRDNVSCSNGATYTLRPAPGQDSFEIRAMRLASSLGSWTNEGDGVYSLALGPDYIGSGAFGAFLPLIPDADGLWTRLTRNTTTPTTPAAGEYGSTGSNDTTVLYVRLPGDLDPATTVVEVVWGNSVVHAFDAGSATGTAVHLRNAVLTGGASACAIAGTEVGGVGIGGQTDAADCIARYSGLGSGFSSLGGFTDSAWTRCEAYGNVNDGFNIHGTAGHTGMIALVDCEAHHNRDEGYSCHDDTVSTMTGGRLYANQFGGATHVNNADVTMTNVEVDDNRRSSAGLGVGDTGGINYMDTTTGAVTGCDVHDNPAEGIKVFATATVTVSGNTSGTASGNGLADNLAAT